MKLKYILASLSILFYLSLYSQVGIGNTNPQARLDISASNVSTPNNTDGILIPRMDIFPTVNPTAAQDGMLIFITGNSTPSKGFYYWDNGSTSWVNIKGVEKIDDLSDGKSDSDGSQDGSSIFLGIGAGQNDDSSHNQNVGIGFSSLSSNTTGYGNAALGYNTLSSNVLGNNNVAIGFQALLNNDASENIAIGIQALQTNTSGYRNVGIGSQPLYSNTTGFDNIGIGYQVLHDNTTGRYNIALGYRTLFNNNGWNNFATGFEALLNNDSGGNNIAQGYRSLFTNSTGDFNIALGYNSLYSNSGGNSNIGIGNGALTSNSNGHSNIAIGLNALNNSSGSNNIGIGRQAGYFGASGSGNIYIGQQAGYHHVGDNTLWIENSSANEDSALIYGEFNTNILRTNSEFQIGNPTGTGYAFPTADGSANQVLQTDGNGTISWSTLSSVSGTTNYIPKFSGATTLSDSQIYDSGTNIGIGTVSPSEKLSVDGIINLNQTITSGIAIKVNGDEALWYNGSRFSWGFGGTQNYFADDVGIGINNPSHKLDVRTANNTDYVAQIYNTSSNTEADGLKIRIGTPPPGLNNYFVGFYGGNDVLNGRISGNGSVGVIYSTVSDKRLKQNIIKVTDALDTINKINPVHYQFISNPSVSEYGFIAQELQPIYPQAVSGSVDSNLETDPMMVDYSRLTPLLTAGLQELYKKVKILELENEALKSQLQQYETLEARLTALETKSKTNN